MNLTFQTAQQAFLHFGNKLLSDSKEVYSVSPRGQETKELLFCNFCIENIEQYITSRTRLSYAYGELLWYMRGNNILDGVDVYAPFWKMLVDDKGKLNSNYGYYLFTENRLRTAYNTLIKDNNSRKAVSLIFNVDSIDSKDTTCTIYLQWVIRENKLHTFVTMRSNDILRGFSYDVMMFSLFSKILFLSLTQKDDPDTESIDNLELGNLYYSANSLHFYERDREDLVNALKQSDVTQLPSLDFTSLYEVDLMMEYELKLRTEFSIDLIDKYNFKSEFWNKGKQVLYNKFKKLHD